MIFSMQSSKTLSLKNKEATRISLNSTNDTTWNKSFMMMILIALNGEFSTWTRILKLFSKKKMKNAI